MAFGGMVETGFVDEKNINNINNLLEDGASR